MNQFSPINENILKEMVQVIVQEVEPVRVILFGSHARGNPRPDSDIDFLVIEKTPFGKDRSRRKEAVRLWKALARFRIPKDILVFSEEETQRWKHACGHIVGQALREGKILYESQ